MQQFTVPQFIDVEDKIIGPITARQFIIMLSGFMLIILWYQIFRFTPFLVISIFTFAISGMFAFFKVNGMGFHFFVLNIIQSMRRPGLRVWNNDYGEIPVAEEEHKKSDGLISAPPKRFSASRLTELSLIVDTKGAYKGGGIRMEDDSLPVDDRYRNSDDNKVN